MAAGDGGDGCTGAEILKPTRPSFVRGHHPPRASTGPHSQGHDGLVSRRGNVHPLIVRGAVVPGGVQDFFLRVKFSSVDHPPIMVSIETRTPCDASHSWVRGEGKGGCVFMPCSCGCVSQHHRSRTKRVFFRCGTPYFAGLQPCALSLGSTPPPPRLIAVLEGGSGPLDTPLDSLSCPRNCTRNRALAKMRSGRRNKISPKARPRQYDAATTARHGQSRSRHAADMTRQACDRSWVVETDATDT